MVNMKIAIIGAGFTGLSAAYKLTSQGHAVTILEKESQPGGLAIGFSKKEWKWSIEKHYHHWFTNDNSILNLAKKVNYPVEIKRPITSVYIQKKLYQLDSIINIIKFPLLNFFDKTRMVMVLAFLRYYPFWRHLEKINANQFLTATMGKKAYDLLWKTQLDNKMGKYANEVSLVWFWSRIKKRTSKLAYPVEGFLPFAEKVAERIKKQTGEIKYNAQVVSIKKINSQFKVSYKYNNKLTTEYFDKVIFTLAAPVLKQVVEDLPESYKKRLVGQKSIGAINLILRLRHKFMPDNTYWLSICEKNSPVMVLVEHTNFMESKFFNNEHLLYVGNYLESTDPLFLASNEELLERYESLLNEIHPGYKKDIIGVDVFRAPFAQPVVPIEFSKKILPMKTPIDGLIMANMQQVYPWDRGTNYAVELGEKAAEICLT